MTLAIFLYIWTDFSVASLITFPKVRWLHVLPASVVFLNQQQMALLTTMYPREPRPVVSKLQYSANQPQPPSHSALFRYQGDWKMMQITLLLTLESFHSACWASETKDPSKACITQEGLGQAKNSWGGDS